MFKKALHLSQFKELFKVYFQFLGWGLLFYTLVRAAFAVGFSASLAQLTFLEWCWAFIFGLRFDLIILGPFIFLSFLGVCLFQVGHSCFKLNSIVAKFIYNIIYNLIFGFFLLFFTALYWLNFLDVELVKFTGRRFTKAQLYLWGEGSASNLAHTWLLALVTVIGLILFFTVFYKKLLQLKKLCEKNSMFTNCLGIFILLPLTVLFSRGGFQYKPLSFVDAKIIDKPYAHQLVLNSSFTFLKSFSHTEQFQKVSYFRNNEHLQFLNLSNSPSKAFLKNFTPGFYSNYNLVIVIVESLSSEYVTQENMPFFIELSKNGKAFPLAYANGRRSIEGIASIMAGIPALMDEPFLNTEFATNDFVGLGQLLKKKNYQTSFFHGAKNGTMRFDVFTKASGFDYYFGLNEYPHKADHDGAWGIYDKPYLAWTCEQLTNMPTPFASAIFTLSSHHPYKLPTEFLKTQPPEKPAISKSMSYVDEALKNFMSCAESKPWYEQTLFVFLADHTGPVLNEATSTFRNKFEIPIVFFAKNMEGLRALSTAQLAQQIDVLPTLNDLLALRLETKNHLARSLLEAGPKKIVLYSDKNYELVSDESLTLEQKEKALKAFQQYFSEGLYDNRLYFPMNSVTQ